MDNKFETFYRKNDIGVNIEYTIVGRYKNEDRDYIIYTDFVSDERDFVRLYVDMVNGDKQTPLSDTGKEKILDLFRNEIGNFFEQSIAKE